MSTINKQALVNQINAQIASFTLATENTQTLALWMRIALNAGANADNIITELRSRLVGVSGSATVEELLLLAVSTDQTTMNKQLTVPDLATLDTLTNISAGTVIYVDSESAPYIRKLDNTWALIDPSLQPLPVVNAWSWGSNTSGQLGDNTTATRSSPVSVVGGFSDWTSASAGGSHSLGTRANGTVWSWGSNSQGQLGDNTTTLRSSPVSVMGQFSDWTSVSAGGVHSLGLRASGSAWAWGNNLNGRLGDGTATSRQSPVSVVGGFSDWTHVSGGERHSLALRASGSAWAWGNNGSGRLGDNTIVDRSSPVSVVGGFADWTSVSAGGVHSLGTRANGTVWSWGNNANGRLGDGTTVNKSSPVSVMGGFSDWTHISAGSNHSLAIRANGTAWAWGCNGSGRLGDGTTTQTSSPVSVTGGFSDWTSASAGLSHSLALRANGSVWAWGSNNQGHLGDLTVTARSSPVSVVGGFSDWISVSASSSSLGIRAI